jgi:hypothetical protein
LPRRGAAENLLLATGRAKVIDVLRARGEGT